MGYLGKDQPHLTDVITCELMSCYVSLGDVLVSWSDLRHVSETFSHIPINRA